MQLELGWDVGCSLDAPLGPEDGVLLGAAVGAADGADDGSEDGMLLDNLLGAADGWDDGWAVGALLVSLHSSCVQSVVESLSHIHSEDPH